MTEHAELRPLDKIDLAALRQATSVSFHHQHEVGHWIVANRERTAQRAADPFGDREDSYRITTDGGFTRYDGSDEQVSAFAMIQGARYSAAWQTILGILRPGDRLDLRWIAGNGNGYLRDANLVKDELELRVHRGPGKVLTFWIDDCICPPSSSARMVRSGRSFAARS